MKHYVFLEVSKEACTQAFVDEMNDVLQEAHEAIDGFEHYEIVTENNSTDDHIRLLIPLTFINWEVKDQYLAHPLHASLLQKVKPVFLNKAIFDSDF